MLLLKHALLPSARISVSVSCEHPEGVAMDQRYPASGQPADPAQPAPGTGHRGTDSWTVPPDPGTGHHGTDSWTVPPDPGCYEERYKVAGVVVSLAASLLVLGLLAAILGWHPQLIVAAFTVVLAIPTVLAMALHPVAFRADHGGVTLGAVRVLPPRPAVFIPWADIEQIILYPAGSGRKAAEYVGVQRHEGAPALPYGNKWAPDCPIPGVAAGAARRMNHWRLDRARLAAVTAAVAPGIPIIEVQEATPYGALGDRSHPWGRPPRPL